MWDQRYSEPGFAYGTQANDFLKAEYRHIPQGGRVLCLAEGEGRNAVFLAQQGYSVTAVDQSAIGLEKARQLAADNKLEIEIIVTDLAEYDFCESCWDGIVSISAHMPEALRARVHRGVVQSLKPGGVLLLEAYTLRHLEMPGIGGPPADAREFFMSVDKLETELDGLKLVHAKELERFMSEGKYHHGESATVQIIGVKP